MIAVDLEKVLLAVCQGCNEEFPEEPCEPGFCMIRSAIKDVPTLTLDDLRPKGRWIMKETMIRSPFAKNAYCSECNEETSFLHGFCPSCGADMRGGREDA